MPADTPDRIAELLALPQADRLADSDRGAVPLRLVEAGGLEAALAALPPAQRAWAEATGFRGRLGQLCPLPDGEGRLAGLLFGWGDAKARARSRLDLGRAAESAPDGLYALAEAPDPSTAEECALGWLLSRTRLQAYKAQPLPDARLAAPQGVDAARLHRIADGVAFTRRLINLPACDLGPAEIETAARLLAEAHGAQVESVVGDDLLSRDLPLIHAVGRAASPGREPRLISLTWGEPDAPKLTLVGKGIAFDTGGLNLKPGGSMGLMKKDMGGAGQVLGLARIVMASGLPVRLRVLIPAAENAVSGPSFRPGDVLPSRKGLSVEINNTDAEGRLVLADALALADEESPDLLLCYATLTGAARVALGPELPPFYTDDEALAAGLSQAAARVKDPLWRMPFWDGYEEKIEPAIADLDNAPSGGMAGSITAALFLRRFVENAGAFAHFDVYGWTPAAKPGRPKGGEAQGIRAAFEVIEDRWSPA
ncbi:MAG: leucyl aminopeptidase family protein [Pseudomonadota bacterium]